MEEWRGMEILAEELASMFWGAQEETGSLCTAGAPGGSVSRTILEKNIFNESLLND